MLRNLFRGLLFRGRRVHLENLEPLLFFDLKTPVKGSGENAFFHVVKLCLGNSVAPLEVTKLVIIDLDSLFKIEVFCQPFQHFFRLFLELLPGN